MFSNLKTKITKSYVDSIHYEVVVNIPMKLNVQSCEVLSLNGDSLLNNWGSIIALGLTVNKNLLQSGSM